MSPYDAFELYIAVKTHFNSPSFDFHKFNGKTRLTPNSFDKRKIKHFSTVFVKNIPKPN